MAVTLLRFAEPSRLGLERVSRTGQPLVLCNPRLRFEFGVEAKYRLACSVGGDDPHFKAGAINPGGDVVLIHLWTLRATELTDVH